MASSKMMGSLDERLMGFIGTTTQRDVNYEIALAMLKNYGRLRSLSIQDIADLCFVSKASVSRFCRFLGFDSFRDLHECLEDEYTFSTDYTREFFDAYCQDPARSLERYAHDISRNIEAVCASDNVARAPEIARAISQSKRVAFFSHHFLWDVGRHMQSKMIHMDRHVELYLAYDHQLTCAESLTQADLAIVCSVGGSYPLRYPKIWNALTSANCPIAVITQALSSPYWNQTRHVLGCGVTNRNDLGKYGALMAIDLLILEYLRLYGRAYY